MKEIKKEIISGPNDYAEYAVSVEGDRIEFRQRIFAADACHEHIKVEMSREEVEALVCEATERDLERFFVEDKKRFWMSTFPVSLGFAVLAA